MGRRNAACRLRQRGTCRHVVDGVNGWLTPIDDVAALRDALARVLSDESLRQSLIANGFETYSQGFTPEAVTAQWIAFYKSVEQNVGLTALKDRTNPQPSLAPVVIPELDYPDVSAGGRGFENISEFCPKVMAGLDPAIQ